MSDTKNNNENNSEVLLDIQNLKTYFNTEDGVVKAVNGISLKINKGDVLGLVGESGSGKSVSAFSIIRLVPSPPGVTTGKILFKGQDILELPVEDMHKLRGKEIAMIFQEPMSSLNPVIKIGEQVKEVMEIHTDFSEEEIHAKTIKMLEDVGIPSPESRMNNYPHELSGGMLQRVMIAIALACNPALLIADEPTTALDVTVQAQILDLIQQMKEKHDSTVILITHDLAVVAETANVIAVMYAGNLVEKADVKELFSDPKHPYTQGLLDSIPMLGVNKEVTEIPGQVPNLIDLPHNCPFVDRCSKKMDICKEQKPQLKDIGQDHMVRCFLYHKETVEKDD